MSLDTTTERKQALETLTGSEGWLLFRQAMEKEWGDTAIVDRLTEALAKIKDVTPTDEQREFTKLVNARNLVRTLLAWPQRELDKLRGHQPDVRPSIQRRA